MKIDSGVDSECKPRGVDSETKKIKTEFVDSESKTVDSESKKIN